MARGAAEVPEPDEAPASPEGYRQREARMQRVAEELRTAGHVPYVIPEGGSNGLGSLGYVAAMEEVRAQLDAGEAGGRPFDVVVHACGSGGTAAGVALGARQHGVAATAHAMAVCDDEPTFERRIAFPFDVTGGGERFRTCVPSPRLLSGPLPCGGSP